MTTTSTPAEWAAQIEAIFYETELDDEALEQLTRIAEIVERIQEQTILKTVAAMVGNTVDVRKFVAL